jgi:hypothetical protein
MSAYHREHRDTFISRAAGLTAIGALVGVGLTRGAPYLGKALEAGFSSNFGQRLVGNLARAARTSLVDSERLAEEFMSAEGSIWMKGAQEARITATTALTSERRLGSIISNLRSFTDDVNTFDSDQYQSLIRRMLGKVASADDPADIDAAFRSFEGLKKFNEQSEQAGVKYKFETLSQQHEHLMDFVREAGTVKPTIHEINEYLKQDKVQASVREALQASRRSKARMLDALEARFKTTSQDIVFGHLWRAPETNNPAFNQELHDRTSEVLGRELGDMFGGQQHLAAYIEKTRRSMVAAFGGAEDSEHFQMAWDSFLASRTGFKMYQGKIVNWQRPQWAAKELLDRALQNVQIPLVPYHFNVSLRSLKIAPRLKDTVRGLGLVTDNPEIERMLKRAQAIPHPSTRLLAIGDQLLAMGPEGAEHLPGSYQVFDGRQSTLIRRTAEVRSLNVEGLLDEATRLRPDSGQSKAQRFLYNTSPNWAKVGYDPKTKSFKMIAKNDLALPLVHRLYGGGEIDPRTIHPKLLAEFIENNLPHAVNNPQAYVGALSSLISEAGHATIDSAELIKRHINGEGRGMLAPFRGSTAAGTGSEVIYHMMRSIDQPDVLIHHLFRDLPGHGGKNILELTSETKNSLTPQLYRALQSTSVGFRTLGDQAKGEGDLFYHLRRAIKGESGISPMMEKLQRGLLSQMLGDMGVAKYGGYEELSKTVLALHENITAQKFDELVKSHQFVRDLRDRLGITSTSRLNDILGRLTTSNIDSPVHLGHLAEISSLLLEKNSVLGLTDDNLIRAKLINQLRTSLESLPIPIEVRAHTLRDYMFMGDESHEWLTDTVRRRFHALRPFHPQDFGPNPLFDAKTYTIPTNSRAGLAAFLESPIQYARDMWQNAGGVGHFARAHVDPNTPYGMGAMFSHMLSVMPQGVAESVGLGLPSADQITPLRATVAWWAKRVLPLYIGLEAYKNLNANAHELGLPGVDDLGANVVANVNRISAGVKDVLGITHLEKSLVSHFPGLDQYMHPRSKEEYEEYLFYGDEEVREGRGWFTGQREPLTGGRIKYVRPNFYRRWRSHWTEASNVDISNPAYSWLPSPLHPLAPLHRLMNPDWFTDKHLADRPYRAGGLTGIEEPHGNYLQTNAMGADGSWNVQSGIGGGLPTTLTTEWNKDVMLGQVGMPMGGGPFGVPANTYRQGREPVRFSLHKEENDSFVQDESWLSKEFDNLRSRSGMFGAFLNKMPLFPHDRGIHPQNPNAAHGNKRLLFGGEYGELSGSLGEFMRRVIQPDHTSANDYNMLPNNQPSWMPQKFQHGDPYLRTPGGEFNVPGAAAESLNPWYAPLKVRGSALGLSEDEIIHKWLYPTEPIGSDEAQDIVDFGSAAHKIIQRQLNSQGELVGAEVSIYDGQHNISGTIDAIIRGTQGLELWDIKTQGGKHWGEVPEKYLEQVTAYMAITGIPRGGLAFVNRDDPDQVRFVRFNFDPARWGRTLEKIEHARQRVEGMVESGQISPFETYDLLARIDILSKIAPNSQEFRELVEYAGKSGGFGGFEKQRFEQALERARHLRENYRLYPKRHVPTEEHNFQVQGITDNGEIVTDMGVLKLAGVKFDAQAFAYDDPDKVLKKYGIEAGDHIRAELIQGQYNPDTMRDMTTEVIVGGVNRHLINSVYAGPDNDQHPLAVRVRGEENGVIGRLWEHLVHGDSMINNKFLRVRTALEQLERGEMYGTDDFRWSDIFETLVVPTYQSVISKNPLAAGLKGAVVGSIFLRTARAKAKGAAIGATVGVALSLGRVAIETVQGHPWKPRRVDKQEAFDEYWDILEFVKFSTMAEAAKKKAKKEEHIDLDALEESEKRQLVDLGPWATLAIHAERKARSTMYGYDELKGSLQEALMAVPLRHQQLAESVIQTGTIQEKRRFYDLLSNPERRALGRFLNVDESSLPDRPDLKKYFHNHFLPEAQWKGWSEDSDIHDLRTRALEAEGTKIERPNRNQVERSRAMSSDVRIPKMKAHTPHRIRATIERLMSRGDFGSIKAKYVIRPAEKNVINIKLDVHHDQTQELIAQAKGQLYSN